ncbi:fibronectin type III domain-containing protein [Bacillus safensis]|uniref:fibronectin type III domain-containing protein n=1 Tax=Bacillus safensis TaxID=561879 RepID=UPI00339191B4
MITSLNLNPHSVSQRLTLHPNAPRGLTASSTDTSVSLSWEAVDYVGGIKEYEIYRNGSYVAKRVGTSFSESGLTPDTTYSYAVKAVSSNGSTSDLSQSVVVGTKSPAKEGE